MRPIISRTERAQMAMAFEVCAWDKPGNVDRCHDYPDTKLEHFLASVIFCRSALEKAEQRKGSVGALIREATILTGRHKGGNTHFGAFILLIPLIMGGTIRDASEIVRQTTIEDALDFYDAFAHTTVRVRDEDELDINDPKAKEELIKRKMTFFDVMEYSAPHDLVAREITQGFPLTRYTADLLITHQNEINPISKVFLKLLSEYPDTFIAKKFGVSASELVREKAAQVLAGKIRSAQLDEFCLDNGYNPGSLADIMISGLYVALGEGWEWDH
ncbi:MAG: ATP:dephospho-CoA triphosphoribosyl transferase [Euryarchaeota archaeon ADurb.Bin294]|jgi:triphosphoribosyl-dephospho-CoA synthase|nr:MAG: ATP:dephospho-CoA triphosphoribosyl transferase [Euryarchaeota archaeon ADurb.Bin294]